MPLEIPCDSQNRRRQSDLVRLLDDLLPQSLQQRLVLVRREVEAVDERLPDTVQLVLSVGVIEGEDSFMVYLGCNASVPGVNIIKHFTIVNCNL